MRKPLKTRLTHLDRSYQHYFVPVWVGAVLTLGETGTVVNRLPAISHGAECPDAEFATGSIDRRFNREKRVKRTAEAPVTTSDDFARILPPLSDQEGPDALPRIPGDEYRHLAGGGRLCGGSGVCLPSGSSVYRNLRAAFLPFLGRKRAFCAEPPRQEPGSMLLQKCLR